MNQPLAETFRYNKWAMLTLLEACRTLTDAQLDHRNPACSGSVRELIQHVVGGQQTQVLRTMGRQHEGEPTRHSPWLGMNALIQLARQSSDDLIAIAESLEPDEQVDLPYTGKTYRFPKVFFLVHALEHGSEHRTELKIALNSIGVETPDLDGWLYARAAGYGTEV